MSAMTQAHHPHARWSRAAALGLLLVAAGPILMLAAGVSWKLSIGDEIGFFAVTIGVAIAGAVLEWRFGTWAKIVGIVAALGVGFMLFWTAFGLASPASFFDFMPAVLVLPGALFAVVASVSAIVAGRRHHETVAADARERALIRVVLAVVTLAALASAGLTIASRADVGDASAAAASVSMHNFKFAAAGYSVHAGDTVLVRNDDPFNHTFTVKALGLDETLTPGSEKLIRIVGDAGSYVLYCRFHTGNADKPSKDDMATSLRIG